MAADISVGIAVQGEKEFNKALKECQNTLKQLDSGLKANAAEFDKNENAMRQSKERYELLGNAIEENEKIIEALNDAIKFSTDTYGAAAKKTTDYVTAQNKAREAVAKLRKELEQSDAEMGEIGRDSTRVGRQLENGIGEAAEDVGRKFDQMVEKLDTDLGEIGSAAKFSAIIEGGGAIKDTVSNVIEGIEQVVEGTEDYRRRMSFLEQNAITAGLDPEKLKAITMRVASITGDMDGAIEGVSNLAAAGLSLDEIATAADRLVSAAIMWPDTLKFESLADGLQETIATKSAVGSYAELLERLGLDLETVNESLEGTKTAGATQTAAMAWMTGHGLDESLQNYVDMNAELIAAEDAQLRYNDAIAKFGEALVPVHTEWTNFKTDFVNGVTEFIDTGFDEWIGGLEEKLRSGLGLNEWMQNLLGMDLYNKLFVENREEAPPPPTAGAGMAYAGYVDPASLVPKEVKPGAYAGMVEFGADLAMPVAQGFEETTVKEIDGRFVDAMPGVGKDAVTSLADGVNEYGFLVINKSAEIGDEAGAAMAAAMYGSLAAGMETWMPLINATPIYGPQQQGGSVPAPSVSYGKAGNVILNLDGRELGRTGGSYIGAQLGASVDRTETYGP